MNKPLRRRLQRAVRYHAWVWREQSWKERCRNAWQLLWRLPFVPMNLLVDGALFLFDLNAKRGTVGNVNILDVSHQTSPTFLRVTTEALNLIRQADPRRFRRLQQEVRAIVNYPQWALGTYERRTRKCKIKFASIPCTWVDPTDSDYQWYLSYYAAVLIHEATHGHFFSLGIPYIRSTRVDIERLCVQEEHRFALRLFPDDSQRADALVPPFDATKWQQSWQQSRWQRAKSDWQAAMKAIWKRE